MHMIREAAPMLVPAIVWVSGSSNCSRDGGNATGEAIRNAGIVCGNGRATTRHTSAKQCRSVSEQIPSCGHDRSDAFTTLERAITFSSSISMPMPGESGTLM